MSKRLFFLAALIAVFAASALAGQAFANVDYEYPGIGVSCDGAQDHEWIRTSLINESGQTIHVRRYWKEVGVSGKKWLDGGWYSLWNNQSRDLSLIKVWPTDIDAVGFDVQESVSGVYRDGSIEDNYCGY